MPDATLSVRPGWVMPEPPAEGLIPLAHLVGEADGWDMYWGTVDPEGFDDAWEGVGGVASIAWPFGEDDIATPEDMESAGFTVVD